MSKPEKSSGRPRSYRRINRELFPGRDLKRVRVRHALTAEVSIMIRKQNLVDQVVQHFTHTGSNMRNYRLGNDEAQYALRHEIDQALFSELAPVRKAGEVFDAGLASLQLMKLTRDIARQRVLKRSSVEATFRLVERVAESADIGAGYIERLEHLLSEARSLPNGNINFRLSQVERVNRLLRKLKADVIEACLAKHLGMVKYWHYLAGVEILHGMVVKKLGKLNR